MPLSFEMPPRLASSPLSAPIHEVVHPIFLNHPANSYPDKNPKPYMDILSGGYTGSNYQPAPKLDLQPFQNTQAFWKDRIDKLNKVFQISGEPQLLEAPDRLVLQNERYHLHVYKASDSFLYFDRQSVSPTDPQFAENLIGEDVAYGRAKELLHSLGLYDDKLLQFIGFGYTGVSVDKSTGDDPESPSPEYKTEIKVHFRFKLNGLPVFGPGAKIVVSYAGNALSQVLYFWRTPRLAPPGHFSSSKVNQHRPLLSHDEALDHFSHDNRFAKMRKGNAKVRFHDLQLGYYARSPQDVQRFLYPVYQVSGTVETWRPYENGFSGIKEQLSGDVFRHHFTQYMLAVSDPNVEEKRLFGPQSKVVTTF